MISHFLDRIIVAVLFLLLPLVPSILVYKISPKDKISTKGRLFGFTINATGAFASYLICCLFLFYFVIKDFNAQIKEETTYKNDLPSLISQKVLSGNSWEAKYTPESEPNKATKFKVEFAEDGSGNICLIGITTRKNVQNENVEINEWKSKPFKMTDLNREFELEVTMKWLQGQLQFDTLMKYEIDKPINGKLLFKSDYLLRGIFVEDNKPSNKWGVWLSRPPD